MPCVHNHHHSPPILHSRDPHDEQISSSAAIGMTIGLTLIAVVVAALVYFWCWRQNHRRRRSRRQNSESRHRRENQGEHADNIACENGARAAGMEQVPQGQGVDAHNEDEPPLPTVPLTIHHHQHEDKHFHGGHYHNHHGHQHEDDQKLGLDDHDDSRGPYGSSHRDRHNPHHYHRHHRFRRTQHILRPRDPIAEFEELIQPLSPRVPMATRADLEAILNGLDMPLPDELAQTNGRVDTAVNEQGTGRRGEEQKEKRRKRHHHHRHHCHRRHKRVSVH